MRVCVRTCLVLACLFAAQSAWAQATIAGAVKDSSGAVLPGVTVEAASPALIEKVRTTTTDGAGRYRIEDLRPGTYVVTFTLPGFVTMRRDGRRTLYRTNAETLRTIHDWCGLFARHWRSQLRRIKAHAEEKR